MHRDASLAAERIRRFLEQEPVVWLSTVRPDGSPHLVPVWFWWDGEALVVRSKPDAVKVRNLRADPHTMLALGHPDEDFDVGLFRGLATLEGDRADVPMLEPGFAAKYRERIAALGLSEAAFAATYRQVIRIIPAGYLGWHGRSTPASQRVAGAPRVSLDDSLPDRIRSGIARLVGEPSLVGDVGFAGA
jgi:PPOX class probable F420-dependent enzyme